MNVGLQELKTPGVMIILGIIQLLFEVKRQFYSHYSFIRIKIYKMKIISQLLPQNTQIFSIYRQFEVHF